MASGPDVTVQLREHLRPQGWRTTLLAVNGAVIADMGRHQLDYLPPDANHLVVSVGGKNALRRAHLLDEGARSMAGAVGRLADAGEIFAQTYRTTLEAVLARGLPTVVCTIYDGPFPDPHRQRLAETD